MPDEVVLVRKSGDMTWGEKDTNRKTVRARVEEKNALIYITAGENKVLTALITIKEINVNLGDKVEIEGVEHPILSIKKLRAFNRTLALELGIG
jgi:hypothetical protein